MFFDKRSSKVIGKVFAGGDGSSSGTSDPDTQHYGYGVQTAPASSPVGMNWGPAKVGMNIGGSLGGIPGAILGGLSGAGLGYSQTVSEAEAMGLLGRPRTSGSSVQSGGVNKYGENINAGNGGGVQVGQQILSVNPNSIVGNFLAGPGTPESKTAASYEQQAIDYLKEREALPRQFSEQALRGLGGLYGMEGGTGSQQELIDRAIKSPLYQSIIGGQEAGEESILRNAAMTGGLRSGNIQSSLYDYNTQLRNKALLEAYNQQIQGLTGLAGLPSNANQIAQGMVGMGETVSSGQVAARQEREAEKQQDIDKWMGIGQLGLGLLDSGIFSDRRLKKNLEKIGEVNGHNWYKWDWNVVANKMGLTGKSEGVLADEIIKTNPDCVGFLDGFITVKYKKLGCFNPEVINGCQ